MAIEVDDGRLEFHFHRPDGECEMWAADLIELKLTCEALEEKHGITEAGGVMRGTVGFFRELAAELAELGCPAELATPTAASRIWDAVNRRFVEVTQSLSAAAS